MNPDHLWRSTAFTKAMTTSLLLAGASLLFGCGPGDEGSLASPPTAGATASLSWESSGDPTVSGYYVHYGKHPAEPSGSCSYDTVKFVPTPNAGTTNPGATLTNLDYNTPYYFAISAFNGLESPCTKEAVLVTPATPGNEGVFFPPSQTP